MSHCIEGNRISFPPAYRIRALPELPAPEYIEEHSPVASAHSVGTAIRDSLDDVDRCFITNIHRHTDKRARLVNTQQYDHQEKQDVVCQTTYI